MFCLSARRACPENYIELFYKEIVINGGSEAFLHNGSAVTPQITSLFAMDNGEYSFTFTPTVQNTFFVEAIWPQEEHDGNETLFSESCREYHFHDTGRLSPLRRPADMMDTAYLRPDGENLAPFLLYMRSNHPRHYQKIIRYIRLVAPFFYDFHFNQPLEGQVWLDWKQKNSDYPMKPYHFSDGTLRFIALTTALLQPNPPSLMLIDEPELGLHPDAVGLVADLMKVASQKSQLVVATQSPALIDSFAPENVVIVRRKDGASVFERLKGEEYRVWLDEFSLGDLWRKNIIPGGAAHE